MDRRATSREKPRQFANTAGGKGRMPTYEFKCKNCARKVILVISFKDYEKKGHKCPKCGSKRLERLISTVHIQTSSKS
jgi:putative FmdB family regulatory protein